MKKSFCKRVLAAVLSAVMLSTAVSSGSSIWAANIEKTPGIQLQTILIDNNGNNWTTESWGGQNMTPNTNWTTLLLGDYYENGYLNFEVKNDNATTVEFNIGLSSKKHNEQVKIYWTDMEEYQNISAGADWTSYSLPIKALVDANPDSGFDQKG